MPGGPYSLIRERDGVGESGQMLKSINPKTGKQEGENGEVILGCALQCGSFYARTYQVQDWWLTTPVTEILEQAEDGAWVKVKTGNSVYMVKSIHGSQ